jgi:hypothetical protein
MNEVPSNSGSGAVLDRTGGDFPRNGSGSVLRPPIARTVRRNGWSARLPSERFWAAAMIDIRRYPRTVGYFMSVSAVLFVMTVAGL